MQTRSKRRGDGIFEVGAFLEKKDIYLEAERAEKTEVGAAKPFGRPPILCSAEVALAAYIGAGGGVKWVQITRLAEVGRSHLSQPVAQTPIRRLS